MMRNVRWKRRYLTGDAVLDARNQSLVTLLTDLRAELERAEHCSEIKELYTRLADLTADRLADAAEKPAAYADSDAAIRSLLENEFPLASLSTPACRDCGLCDLIADRVEAWLSGRNLD